MNLLYRKFRHSYETALIGERLLLAKQTLYRQQCCGAGPRQAGRTPILATAKHLKSYKRLRLRNTDSLGTNFPLILNVS